MSNIYVVMGETGEYSDHIEWPTKAFASEDAAKEFVLAVSEAARVTAAWKDASGYEWRLCSPEERPQNPLDPNMQVDYAGVNYSYFAVELVS